MENVLFFLQIFLYGCLIVSALIFPLCIIYKAHYSRWDSVLLWISPQILYFLFMLITLFGNRGVMIVFSVEIFSLLTLLSTIVFCSIKRKKLKMQIGLILLLHVEVLLFVLIINQTFTSIIYLPHSMYYLILMAIVGVEICITPLNKWLVQWVNQKKKDIIFTIIMILTIISFYFYQLVYPVFLESESIKIHYEGDGDIKTNSGAVSASLMFFFLFLIGIIILAIMITRYLLLTASLKSRRIREQELVNYIETMEVLQTDIRKIHHDYRNLITALGGYLYEEDEKVDIVGLKAFYQQNVLVQKDTELKTINLCKLKNLNILEMKGLLAAKLIQASQQSIQVSLEIQDNIDQLPMDKLDLSRMTGILLDNAIEAAANSIQPEMRIALIKEDSFTLLVVENSTQEVNLPITTLKQRGISTKGSQRGLGLYNLAEILEKYSNIYQETTLKDGFFTQRITLLHLPVR